MRHRHVAAAMMNVVAIGLVLSTLAAAGVWSPAPPPTPPAAHHHGDHVVREGRRVVIVEYERELPLSTEDGGTVKVKETRVLPPDALDGVEGDGGVFDEARGVVSDAAGKVAGAAEEGKERLSDAKGGVLGAVKRCKDRLCGAGRKVEEGAKDAAYRVEHGTEAAARGAMEVVSDAKDSAEGKAFYAAEKGKETIKSAKDKASDAAHQGKEAVRSAKDKAFDAAHQGKETVESAKDKVSEAAGKAKEKASDIQQGAAEAAKAAKEKASEAARHAKETVRSARDSVSEIAQRAEERAEDAAERAADRAAEAEEEVKAKAAEVRKNLTDIARRARDVASDAAAYLLGAPRDAARTATAVMHLLGFATAYGACVWVTFVSSHVLAAALPRQQLGLLQSKLFPVYFRAMAYGVGLALAAHLLGRERRSVASRAQSFNLLAALGLVVANMLLLEPKATKVMFERMKVEKEEGRGRDMVDDVVDPPVVTVATPGAGTTTTTTVPTAAAAARTGTAHVDGAGTGGRQAKPAAATAGDAEMWKSRAVRLSRRLKQLNGYSSLCNVLSLMSLTWHLVHLARRLHAGTAC